MLPFNLNLSAPSSSAVSQQVDGRQGFDGSGWTVSTGGASATGGRSGGMGLQGGFGAPPQQLGSQLFADPIGGGMQTAGGSPVMWLLILGAAGFLLMK